MTRCETWKVCDQSTPFVVEPATDPALLRILTAAGLPATGRFIPKAGWVSRAWVGEEYVSAALQLVEDARRLPGHDSRLLADVTDWVQERLVLFAADEPVLVHGDLHGSNLMVDQGRVTGLIDFAEALAQPADVELDNILHWCAKARAFPPVPGEQGLDETTLTEVPGWLHGAYPELFEREHLRERLNVYDMYGELAQNAHHPQPDERQAAQDRIARLLTGHNHLDGLIW